MNLRPLIFLLLNLFLSSSFGSAQAQNHNFGIDFSPRIGYLIPHRATMAHLTQQHTYGFDVSAVLQTNGEKQWHHDFNFPEIHLGVVCGNLGNKEVLGSLFGLSGGIYLPFYKRKGWSFGSHLAVGLGFVTKHYDVVENPKNNAIGSHLNCLANAGIRLNKQFSHHEIGLKVMMLHLSNGAIKLPNLGVNLPSISLHYTFYLQPIQLLEEATIISTEDKAGSWNFYTQLIASAKQIYPTGGNQYGVLALTQYTQFKASNKCVLEAGIDAIYNESIVKYSQENHEKDKNLQLGLYGAYVLPIHHVQLLVGMGRYIYNPLNPSGMWYHKFGGRFKIIDRLWGNITIKSHWAKADYFEYGLTFKW